MTVLGRNEIKLSFRSSLVMIIYELDGILLIKVSTSDIQNRREPNLRFLFCSVHLLIEFDSSSG
jgi:hypothetical protein